jgi:hypothetical protein
MGHATGFMAEPGSSPWATASTAPAVGWRKRDGVSAACSGDRGRGVPSPWRPCARPTWSRRGHGGAALLGTATRGGAGAKMDQRPGLASRVTARACWGTRLREGVAARTDARANAHATRTRRHGAAATKTGRFPTARGGWLGGRRARVDEGGGTCKKMCPSLARWPASQAAVRRRGAVGVPPRLEGRGVHKREETASSPRWPLAGVERVGEERWGGLPSRKKRK